MAIEREQEIDSKDAKSDKSDEGSEQGNIPIEKRIASKEDIESLSAGLASIAGLPPGIVLPPMNDE